MKKYFILVFTIFTLLIFFKLTNNVLAVADWWQRPEVRPTQPSIERNLPTTAPNPTNPPIPTAANPPTGGPTTAPTNPPGTGSPGTSEDACGSGKSFTGPYCGWSPGVGEAGGGGEKPRAGGPQILGLSDTSSSDVAISDIILLAGVLCLLVYARSKIEVGKLH